MTPSIAILTGPTATGKTALALEWAKERGNIEIINADSQLVYSGMDIGTAKPTQQERQEVRHHLIDIREPDQPYTAGDFVRDVKSAITDIQNRGKRALIVGGTGFYLKALLYGLWKAPKVGAEVRARLETYTNEDLYRSLADVDPNSATRIGPSDRYRLIRALELFEASGKTPTELQALQPKEPDPDFALLVVDRPNAELHQRIRIRIQTMLDAGFIEEVNNLCKKFPNARALNSVGYAQVRNFLEGRNPAGRKVPLGIEGLLSEIELATHQLIKSQRTWFRGQSHAKWFVLDADKDALRQAFEGVYG